MRKPYSWVRGGLRGIAAGGLAAAGLVLSASHVSLQDIGELVGYEQTDGDRWLTSLVSKKTGSAINSWVRQFYWMGSAIKKHRIEDPPRQ